MQRAPQNCGLQGPETPRSATERVDVASYNLAYDAEENCIASATEIERCIAKLKNGKSNGMDNVSSEHLKNCNPRLASMLALCFTKMFSHGYLPANMLSVQLVPIIKSKTWTNK